MSKELAVFSVVGEGQIYEQLDSDKQIESNARLDIDSQFVDLLGQPMIVEDQCSLNSNNEQGIEEW